MRPSEGRGMRQKIGRAIQSLAFSVVDGLTEMLGVPVDDDGGEQIEAVHAEVLAFGGAPSVVRSRISPWRPMRSAFFRA